jgi:hypothetical protein
LVTSPAYVLPGTPDQAIEDSLRSSSVVVKLPRKWLQWQKVASGLALHGSRSENFSPPVGVRVDSQGNYLPPPLGSTKEFGFTVKLMDDRAILRTTWYVGSEDSGGANPTVAGVDGPGAGRFEAVGAESSLTAQTLAAWSHGWRLGLDLVSARTSSFSVSDNLEFRCVRADAEARPGICVSDNVELRDVGSHRSRRGFV